ncbi:cytochrome P450 monooxygenase CYP4Q9, partial [Asbolus verrucosus]
WSILTVLFIYTVLSIKRQVSIRKNLQKLPGPPSTNWLVGNIAPLLGAPEVMFKTVRKWSVEYYPIYQNWAAHITVANILDPHDFETILSSPKHIEKSQLYDMLHHWLGTGLLTSGGSKWHNRRKILTPSFHFNILQEFINIFNEETGKLVKMFKSECHNSYIDVTDYIGDFTLNTIGESVIGQKYKKSIQQIAEMFNYRLLRPLLLNKFFSNYYKERRLVKILHTFTRDVVATREKNFKPVKSDEFSYSKRKRLAMLDLLLTAKREEGAIDDEGIREEVDTFMFEGHDTTTAAICFALLLIASHRDVQDRIVEEMRQVLGSRTKLDYKNLQDLRYLERCIKEVLRLYPSVPFIARYLGEDIVTNSGYHLKAGSMVHLHIYDLHHNSSIYPDPEKFDPDRFLPENCQNRHHFAFVPFSAGPRNCIGQKFAILELKTVLSRIIGNILELHTTPENILKKLREWGRKYYPIYNIRVLYTNAANILTPEDA